MKCAHCGTPKAKWGWTLQACADGGKKRKKKLCDECDIECNRIILEFFRYKDAAEKLAKYRSDP